MHLIVAVSLDFLIRELWTWQNQSVLVGISELGHNAALNTGLMQ